MDVWMRKGRAMRSHFLAAVVSSATAVWCTFVGTSGATAHERKPHCGAAEWRVVCKLKSKTKVDSWNDYWNSVETAKLFFCFNNRGGHNTWVTTIDHLDKDGDLHSSPLAWFDTVRWGGDDLGRRVTWKGTGARLTDKGTSMVGTLTTNADMTRIAYVEKLYHRRKRPIRVTQYACRKKR